MTDQANNYPTLSPQDMAVMASRLRLRDSAHSHSLADLLRATIDEAETLTGSQVGFYHFVEPDQLTLTLQAWSSNTVQHMCQAKGAGLHYPVQQAGAWADCIRQRRPVIHNDYPAMAHRTGLPEGHAPITRELVVPVLREGVIVAVLGVGNKPTHYQEHDAERVAILCDLAWDIVEKKRIAEALRASQQRMELILFGADLGTWDWHVPSDSLTVNERWAAMLGYTLDEIEPNSRGWETRIHPDDKPATLNALHTHLQGQTAAYEAEHRLRHKSGHWIWVLDKGRVIERDPQGQPLRACGTHLEITARKCLEQERTELQARNQQLQKSASLDRMAGAIAHVFNNQLQVVQGGLEMALSKLPDAGGTLVESLSFSLHASRRAAEVSAQMLTYLGQSHGQQVPVDLTSVCRCALSALTADLPQGVVLTSDLVSPGPRVCGNAHQLHQILINLVTNAWEAYAHLPGAVQLSTNLVFRSDISEPHYFPIGQELHAQAYGCLEVADGGCGIPSADLPNLFDPFFSTKFTGRGLGLSMVLGIVREHQGMIAVQSQPGNGSRFRVYLPLIAPESDPGEPSPAEAGPKGPGSKRHGAAGGR